MSKIKHLIGNLGLVIKHGITFLFIENAMLNSEVKKVHQKAIASILQSIFAILAL